MGFGHADGGISSTDSIRGLDSTGYGLQSMETDSVRIVDGDNFAGVRAFGAALEVGVRSDCHENPETQKSPRRSHSGRLWSRGIHRNVDDDGGTDCGGDVDRAKTADGLSRLND